jgi:hypothetical protein
VIILRSCIDTLVHSFCGDVSEEVAGRLDELKNYAQMTECPQPWPVLGPEFFVQPQSVPHFRWLLRNDDLLLMLRCGGVGPSMVAKMTSKGLAERGVEALWAELERAAQILGLTPLILMRLDLAVDFQGWSPTFAEMRNVRCRSKYRPVLPNVDHPETFYFGKVPKMVRLYNKSLEIVVHGKEWWRGVWRSTGRYREDQPVWRLEVELGSIVLKELGCRSMGVALERLSSIWSWALQQTSLGVPNGDTNRARWLEDERWRILREGFGMSEPLSRVRSLSKLLDYEKALQRYLGTMTSVAASLGIANYEEAGRILFDGGMDYLAREGKDFERMVEFKRRRLSE